MLKALPVSVVVLERITTGCCFQNWASEQKHVEKHIKKAILRRRLHCSSPGKQKGCGSCSAASAELIGINVHSSNAAPEIASRGTPRTLAVLLYIYVQCTKYWVSSRDIILSNSCIERHVILPLP